jgi:hypothetical protein
MSEIALHCQYQLNRFRRQYLQLQVDIKYPDSQCLRQETFQNALFEEVFKEDATTYHPPQRYQIRVLKELNKRIVASITSWEEEVCTFISNCFLNRICMLATSELLAF